MIRPMPRLHCCLALLAAGVTAAAPSRPVSAQRVDSLTVPEVRQLVTFRFNNMIPFGTRPALYGLVDLYRATPAVERVRGYRETESPEEFDLLLMTSYQGLEGFERANAELRRQRSPGGTTLLTEYRRLAEASVWHRDQFIEMVPELAHEPHALADLHAFEWVRVVPGGHDAYELLLRNLVLPWERDLPAVRSSESARVLIADGWDYVRILGVPSLAGYHDYLRVLRTHVAWQETGRLVSARKTFIVREDSDLRVR